MIWLAAVLGIAALLWLLWKLGISSKGQRYLMEDAFNYARLNGNVPLSYSEENLLSLHKYHFKTDSEQFSFMHELKFDLQKQLGFMLCFWYSRSLVQFGLMPDLFVQIPEAEIDVSRAQAIAQIQDLQSDAQTVSDAELRLKFLALQGDYKAAHYLSDLLLKGSPSDKDIQYAFYWLIMAYQYDELESTQDKAAQLLASNPHVQAPAEDMYLIEQGLYLEIFKRSPYLENWKELMVEKKCA